MAGWEPFVHDSPASAVAALFAAVRPLGEPETESVSLEQAAGRVLAQDVAADRPSPAVDVSSMDGYAVRLADAVHGTLPIAAEVRIGHEPPPLPPGACVRIVTGGAVPAGTDAVVKREDVHELGWNIEVPATTLDRLRHGENIRRRGENLAAGALAVQRGTPLTPAVAAALATFGVTHPTVYRPLSVHVVNTGDELVPPDETPTPWKLRDSNGPALTALLSRQAFLRVRTFRVRDDEGALRERVAQSLRECDAILLTGGVSMGHRDFVTGVLGDSGVRTLFHGVPQRPGKPVLAGLSEKGRPVLGLPGNPVSVMVTARRMALPVLRRCAGAERDAAAPMVRLTNPDGKTIPLWWHRLVRLSGSGDAELVDTHGSGDLVSAARADGFVEVPPNRDAAGEWPFFAWTAP